MTISTTTSRISYNGNAVTTAFSFPYRFLANGDLVVIEVSSTGVETVKALTTHYTVTGAGDDGGGTVTMLVAPAVGVTLVIYRDTDIVQETDYISGDPFPAETHETALDRLTMIAQEIGSDADRSIKVPVGDSSSLSTTLPASANRLDKFLVFDATTGAAELSTVTQTQVASAVAAAYANGTLAVTGFIATLLDDEDAATARATLGVTASEDSAGFINPIINGDMRIDQRFCGTTQTFTAAAALAYCVDRWYGFCTGADVTGSRVAGSGESQYFYQFTGAASVTSIGFGQRIEGVNVNYFNGQTVTLQVLLANSLLTSVSWNAYYSDASDAFGTLASPTRTSIANGTFTVTSTITKYSTQIAIPSAAAGRGIEIVFSVGAQTSGTWTIGDVMLSLGTSIPPFERVPIDTSILRCQRYYEKSQNIETLPSDGAYGGIMLRQRSVASLLDNWGMQYKVRKRAVPTSIVIKAPNGTTVTNGYIRASSYTNKAVTTNDAGESGVVLAATVVAQETAYWHYEVEAEL